MKSKSTYLKNNTRWLVLFLFLVTGLTGKNASAALTTNPPANPAGNLDQGRNGGVGQPAISPVAWENGNQNPQKSHYQEGQSIPYRLRMTSLSTTTQHTVIIEWDIRDQSKNALDYITSYQRIAETVIPTTGTSLSPLVFTTLAIPAPAGSPQPLTSFNALPASEKLLTLFGGTLISCSYVSQGSLTAGHSSSRLTIKFTSSTSSAILAWGGHIAKASDWGAGKSCGAINGSPYHTRLISLDGKGGNQDRSLKISACTFTTAITITTPLISCKNQCAVLSASGTSFMWSPSNAVTKTVQACTPGTYGVTAYDANSCSATATTTLAPQAALSLTGSTTPNGCSTNSGAIDVTSHNFVGTPHYSWNPPVGSTSEDLSMLSAGTYNVTGTDANGCTANGSFTVGQLDCPPPCNTTAAVNENGTTCNGPYQLQAAGGTDYTWTPNDGSLSANNIANPTANPTITTVYTVTVCGANGPNLVANSNFDLGNTGFYSEYTYVPANPDPSVHTELDPPSVYTVGTDANEYHSDNAWVGLGHGGSGNFMIVNGYTAASKTVWQETVHVIAGQKYTFSTWVEALYPDALAILDFTIDGVSLPGGPFSPVLPPGTWSQYSATYTATATADVIIRIVDNNTIFLGNDYGLDDISFSASCCDTRTVEVSPCQDPPPVPCTVKELSATAPCYNGTSPSQITTTSGFDSYAWDANAALSATNVQNPTASAAGTYCVTALSAGSELIRNGDFTLGDDHSIANGFFSEYVDNTGSQYVGGYPSTTGLWAENRYAVDGVAHNVTAFYHPIFFGVDHTSGTGNYLIVNGETNTNVYATYIGGPNHIVWQQSVTVLGGQHYKFSLWEKNMNNHGATNATLQVSIGTVILSSTITNPVATNTPNNSEWMQFTFDYIAPATGSFNVTIVDLNLLQDGNDFAVDDISLKAVCDYHACVTISACSTPPPCDNFNPNVGPGGSTCGGPYHLHAYGGTSYSWSPADGLSATNIADPIADPLVNTTYVVTIAQAGNPNLVVNGDFSGGDNSFVTDYTSRTGQPAIGDYSSGTGLWPEGYYAVDGATNATEFYHPLFHGVDHTTGTGNYMIVNGATDNSKIIVWKETVAVELGKTYSFVCWIRSLNSYSAASLKFQVGTDILASNIEPNADITVWTKFSDTWTSTLTGNVDLKIVDLSQVPNGNDFGLDDISFTPACTQDLSVAVDVCQNPPPDGFCTNVIVVDHNQGKRKDGTAVLAIRSDITKAEGTPENSDVQPSDPNLAANINFYSLGFKTPGIDDAYLTFDFGSSIGNGTGADFRIFETTWNNLCPTYPERILVYASTGNQFGPWVNIGEGCMNGDYDLANAVGGPLAFTRYVKVVDNSTISSSYFNGLTDGYDVDGIVCLHSTASTRSEDNSSLNEPSVYPNPVSDRLNVSIQEGTSNIKVYNGIGVLVYSEVLGLDQIATVKNIDFTNFASGVYMVAIQTQSGIKTTQVVKK